MSLVQWCKIGEIALIESGAKVQVQYIIYIACSCTSPLTAKMKNNILH